MHAQITDILKIIIGERARGLQPPDLGKAIIFFGQKLNFSGRSQQPKMKEILYLLNEKPEFILSSEIKYSSFLRALSKKFSGKDVSAPQKKLAHMPMKII